MLTGARLLDVSLSFGAEVVGVATAAMGVYLALLGHKRPYAYAQDVASPLHACLALPLHRTGAPHADFLQLFTVVYKVSSTATRRLFPFSFFLFVLFFFILPQRTILHFLEFRRVRLSCFAWPSLPPRFYRVLLCSR